MSCCGNAARTTVRRMSTSSSTQGARLAAMTPSTASAPTAAATSAPASAASASPAKAGLRTSTATMAASKPEQIAIPANARFFTENGRIYSRDR